ncbi:chorismate pyruvate-lyase family protein [Frankia sp. Cppng1_Ct_nod]|uniref:chorismate--pyruvate lyase family protein n=1 Tax=Frankia sp. Cppng1_Ct_nod TaxID=2897162 RepID=UPI001F5F411B|nr:chorismate pyruvate-lyase family protein [Frankia sp. Cppng1_Ct_nod]
MHERSVLSAPPDTSPTVEATPGLGWIEQLVLRGDGLTTTALEILTVRVRRQQRIPLDPSADQDRAAGDPSHPDLAFGDTETYSDIGIRDLDCETGDDLLIREVLLTGDDGVTYGTASVLAVVNRLPVDVTRGLAETEEPIGKLLVRAALPVVRELRAWGLLPAGDFAAHLGPGIDGQSRVPARTYRMRGMLTGRPLTLITEWFAPRLFTEKPGGPDLQAARSHHFASS